MKKPEHKKSVGVKVSLTEGEMHELLALSDGEHLAPSTLARLFVLRGLRSCKHGSSEMPNRRNSALRTPHSALISGVAS